MKKKKKKSSKKNGNFPLVDGNETAQQIKSAMYDPNGMYTGIPTTPDANPEQDADDL